MRGYRSTLNLGYGTRVTEQVSVWLGTSPADTIPLILCHGFLGDATQWYDVPSQNFRVQRAYAEEGCLAVGADLGGFSTWGNDDFIDAMDDVLAYAGSTYGTRTDRVGVYGTSMGGCALNWVWRNPEKVAACALTIPVVDLLGVHDRNPLGLATFIDDAYGGHDEFLAARPLHDPSYSDNLELIAEISDRVRLWYAEDDTIIDADEVLAYSEATGVEATSLGNVGHSIVGDQQSILDWLIPRLRWG